MSLNNRQVWAYGSGDLGVALLYVAVNTHFLYFLVNVAGFTPLAAGFVFVVGRIVDAVTDPLIGSATDRTRAAPGRIAFLRRALLPTALSFVGLFALPLSPVAPVLCAVFGAVLFSVASTCVLMPYLALLPELIADYDARTRAIGVKSAFTMLATLLAFAGPPALVLSLGGGGDLAGSAASAWVLAAAVLAGVFVVPLLIVAYGVPDPKDLPRRRPLPAAVAFSWSGLLGEVRSAWRTAGLRQAVYMFLAVTVAIMITNSLLTFFLESVLLLPGDALPGVLGGLVLVSIVTFPLWIWVGGRIGKRLALCAALAIEIGSLLALVTWVPAGSVTWQLAVVTAVNGVAVGGVTMFPWAMLPDVVELDELANGSRREGLLYALFTFGQKLATSIGVFANSIVIAVFGYAPGSSVQSATTVDALRVMMGPGAALVFGLAMILTWRYTITRSRHAEVRTQLAAMRS